MELANARSVMGKSIATSSMARLAGKQCGFLVMVWMALLSLIKADPRVQGKDKKATKESHFGSKDKKICMNKRRTLWCMLLVFRLSGKMLNFSLDDHHLSNTSFVQGWSRGV